MRLLKRSCLLLLFLFTLGMYAQESSILKTALRLHEANYNMDFDSVASFTHPEVIARLGGKKAFTEKLDTDSQNGGYRKRLQLTAPVFQAGPVKTIGARKFCVITFRNPTRYFYEQPLDTGQMKKLLNDWKQIAATNEVYAEPNRNSINVKRVSKLVGVADDQTGGQWKFFNFDDERQVEVFNSVFAAEKVQLGL